MNIIGHQKILKYLEKSLNNNKFSQAYLFCGPEHLGKFTLARYFCERLAKAAPAGINPDIHVVSPEILEEKGKTRKKNIQVEDIRDLQKKMNLTAYSGHRKAAIIDDAELLTIAAQNALLKTLEEPPADSIFVLVCHNEEKILPTVKSRSVIKRFNLVSDIEIAAALEGGAKDEMVFWSFGRPGLAFNMAKNPELLEKRRTFENDLEGLKDKNIAEKFALAENFSKDSLLLMETLDVWSSLLRKKIISGGKCPTPERKRALIGLGIIEKSADLIRNTNSNIRLVMENLLMNL